MRWLHRIDRVSVGAGSRLAILIKAPQKRRKSLGQHFLVDRQVAERIVDSVVPQPTDAVIEVGPGTGALTRLLTERSGQVLAIEIDDRLADELPVRIGAANLTVLNQDVLQVDWTALAASAKSAGHGAAAQTRVRVVANLPYYISTAIIERLLELTSRQLTDMTLMLQREVVDRITSGPGGRDYGYLSVLVQYRCEATKLFEVPASAFKPPPKVESAVVRLRMLERPAVVVPDESRFFGVVRAAFAHRRKTIANNLKAASALGFSSTIEEALSRARIESRRRAETLSLQEFSALDSELYSD